VLQLRIPRPVSWLQLPSRGQKCCSVGLTPPDV
jgi:hypothetical protein